MVMQKVVKKYK